jgi:hypothetical protein
MVLSRYSEKTPSHGCQKVPKKTQLEKDRAPSKKPLAANHILLCLSLRMDQAKVATNAQACGGF